MCFYKATWEQRAIFLWSLSPCVSSCNFSSSTALGSGVCFLGRGGFHGGERTGDTTAALRTVTEQRGPFARRLSGVRITNQRAAIEALRMWNSEEPPEIQSRIGNTGYKVYALTLFTLEFNQGTRCFVWERWGAIMSRLARGQRERGIIPPL